MRKGPLLTAAQRKQLAAAIKRTGTTMAVAEQAGISRPNLVALITRGKPMGVDALARVCKAIGLELRVELLERRYGRRRQGVNDD